MIAERIAASITPASSGWSICFERSGKSCSGSPPAWPSCGISTRPASPRKPAPKKTITPQTIAITALLRIFSSLCAAM